MSRIIDWVRMELFGWKTCPKCGLKGYEVPGVNCHCEWVRSNLPERYRRQMQQDAEATAAAIRKEKEKV